MGIFKRYYNPVTNTVLTDANTTFVCSITGNNNNPGTREFPIATLTKFTSLYDDNARNILYRGETIENPASFFHGYLIGDGEDAYLNGSWTCNYYGSSIFYGIKILQFTGLGGIINSSINTMLMSSSIVESNFINNYNSLVEGGSNNGISNGLNIKNNTVLNFKNYCKISGVNLLNFIFVIEVDLYNYTSVSNISNFQIFKYCLFRKTIIWKWKGIIVPINYGTYGNILNDYMTDVISAWYIFSNTIVDATEKAYCQTMFPNEITSPLFYIDINGQTCKVVEDRPSIEGSKKIFNRYTNDNPIDYSLFLNSENIALTMSDQKNYVGCYKANADVITFNNVLNVNSDGSDDLVTIPDMLVFNGNSNFTVSSADSVQIRNRIRSNVFTFKRGFSLAGMQGQVKSGLESRFSFGKFQAYNVTDSPSLPQESLEIIPYDSMTEPSSFPRFSVMFNGVCQMWYNSTTNLPILFNDLLSFGIVTDKNLTEYGNWAVTNADYESFLLSSLPGIKLNNIKIYYAKVEINLNYYL